ncbi:hypothetical protein [Flavobacterium agri]|nr:hypothetical protein [Flavobacterium agri]
MKTPARFQEILKHQGNHASKTIARNVGQFYVRVYDCMMVLRLFL